MNETGCPSGWATDQILFYDNTPLACDMSVVAWILIGTILVFLKLCTACGHTHLYYLRAKGDWAKWKNIHAKRRRRRIPLVPVLSWLMVIDLTLIFVLPAANSTANAQNGVPALFFGFGWFLFGILSDIFLLKFVKLGHRIVPNKARPGLAKADDEQLSKLDWKGKISLGLSAFALLCQTIVLCIVAVVIPNNFTVIRVAFGFHAWFCAQHGVSMGIHFERIKNTIRTARDVRLNNDSVAELNRVLRRLTEQEIVVVGANLFATAFYMCLATEAFKPRYFVFTIILWIEAVNFLLILASNYKMQRKFPKTSSSDRTKAAQALAENPAQQEKPQGEEPKKVAAYMSAGSPENKSNNKSGNEGGGGGSRVIPDDGNGEVGARVNGEMMTATTATVTTASGRFPFVDGSARQLLTQRSSLSAMARPHLSPRPAQAKSPGGVVLVGEASDNPLFQQKPMQLAGDLV